MRVHELLSQLIDLPRDLDVVMSKDGEGNGFSPLAEVGETLYIAETTWSGECYAEDDDVPDGAVPAVVLWPTN